MADKLSQARMSFEKFTGVDAASLLQALPSSVEKVFETEWQDFKSGRCADADLKENWSKAIGAFANNEGGTVIWGLRCASDPATKIDAVTGLELVPDVNALKSRLKDLSHVATDPPVSGIQIQAIPLKPAGTEGFVVCYIPESSYKPHRSEFASKRYFLRVGDSSKDCSVSLLRQLFFPKRSTHLSVNLTRIAMPEMLRLSGSKALATGVAYPSCHIEVAIANEGENTADDVIAIFASSEHHFATYTLSGSKYTLNFLEKSFSFGLVHVGTACSMKFVCLSLAAKPPEKLELAVVARDTPQLLGNLPMPVEIGKKMNFKMPYNQGNDS